MLLGASGCPQGQHTRNLVIMFLGASECPRSQHTRNVWWLCSWEHPDVLEVNIKEYLVVVLLGASGCPQGQHTRNLVIMFLGASGCPRCQHTRNIWWLCSWEHPDVLNADRQFQYISMCSIPCINVSFRKKGQQTHSYLFVDHTYMFRSLSATILRVYNIKEYDKKFMWPNSRGSEFIKCYKILKLLM